MDFKHLISLFVLLLFLTPVTYAGSGDFTIKSIGISEWSNTLFIDVNESHIQSECSDKNSFRYIINKENSLYREIYSGLLAAKSSKSTVSIAFTDSAADCRYNSPQIASISIQ